MKIRNAKRLIMILLSFMILAISFLTIVNIHNSKFKFKTNDTYKVSAWSGWAQPLIHILLKTVADMNTFNSKSAMYDGVYFRLENDLDYGIYDSNGNLTDSSTYTPILAMSTSYFAGIFDGNGHTIKNAKIIISGSLNGAGDNNCGFGLFGRVCGEIKNLRSQKLRVVLQEATSGYNYNYPIRVGGIAGFSNGGEFTNCECEDLTVLSEGISTSVDVYGGGIVGECYRTTITDCKGEGPAITFVDGQSYSIINSGIATSLDGSYGGLEIFRCFGYYGSVYADNVTTKIIRDISNLAPYTQRNDSSVSSWVDYSQITIGTTTLYIENSYGVSYYKKNNAYTNLSPSSTWGKTGSTWFYDSNVSAMFPYLRTFVDWYTYEFKTAYLDDSSNSVESTAVGSVSPAKIENVPFMQSVDNYRQAQTTLCGKTIKFTPNSGYTFYRWEWTCDKDNLTAKYLAVCNMSNYTITYDYAGGSGTNPTTYTPATPTFTLNNPTKTGYTFTGWTGTNITTPQTTVKIEKGSTGNKTYTANWQATTYTITYNLNGGSASGNPTTYTVETATFTLNNPTKTGYAFTGWTGSNGSTAQKSVTIAKGSTGDRTYTANWSTNSYTITYNLNGGSASGNPTTYTVETPTFTLNNPTKTGYTFTGWTGSNGSTPQKSVTIAKGSTGDRTYTANWSAYPYTITYILNGGSNMGNPSSYTINTETFTLKISLRTGYNFLGWTGSNGSTPQKSVTIAKGSTGDRTYIANWQATTYTISYDLQGGSLPEGAANPTSYTIETATFTLNNPTKIGYTFTGWTGACGQTPQKSVTISKGTTGNLLYIANWTKTIIAITFTNRSDATLMVNNVEQTANYVAYVYYNMGISTVFDGANDLYLYKLTTTEGENVTITYKPNDTDYWVKYFNLPNEGTKTSREEPTWQADDLEIGGTTLIIDPVICLKEYYVEF